MSKPLLAAATVAAASLMAVLPAGAQPVMTGAEVTSGIKPVHLPSLRGAFGRPEGLSEGKHVRELKKIPLIDGPGWADDHAAQTGYSVSPAAATVPGRSHGYWQCVAVSRTSDATGAYYLYAFPYTQFNDYPKMGVWPDGYYVTFNMFTNVFQGAKVCAYDRAKMLAGQAATQQCFQLSSSYGSLLPADLDGTTAPPAGAPNYLVNRLSGALGYWKFKVDWANAANSTLSGP